MKQGQGALRGTITKRLSKPWQPSTSELQDITFDYEVQVKAALFKRNVNKSALPLGESLKYGGPKVQEKIRSGVGM